MNGRRFGHAIGACPTHSRFWRIGGPARFARFASAIWLAAALAPLLLLSSARAAGPAPDIYKAKCAACHGKKGDGDTMLGKNMNVRPLGSDDVQKQSDNDLFSIISKGKRRMPAYDNRLSRNQIEDLVKYIRTLRQ